MVSPGPTATPCRRRAATNSTRWPGRPYRRSAFGGSIISSLFAAPAESVEAQLGSRLDGVGLVLEHHAEGDSYCVPVGGVKTRGQQGAGPVDRLGSRRRFAQLEAAQHVH